MVSTITTRGTFFSMIFTCLPYFMISCYIDPMVSKQAKAIIPLTSTEIDELMGSTDAFVVLDDFANSFFPQAKTIILGLTTLGANMTTITTRILAGTNTASLTVFCGALNEINSFLASYSNSLTGGQITTLTSGVATLLNGITQCRTHLFNHVSSSASENGYQLNEFVIYLCSGWVQALSDIRANPEIELIPSRTMLANQISPFDPNTLLQNNVFTTTVGGNLSISGTATFNAATTVASGHSLFVNTIAPASGTTTTLLNNLTISGNLTLSGLINGLTPLSDNRIKTDVEAIDPQESLEKILSLIPRRFKYAPDWTQHSISGCEHERGFIAQEVKEVLPELVSINDQKRSDGTILENFHRLDYQKMVVDLVGALQAVHRSLQSVRQEFADYKADMEKRLTDLKSCQSS